MGVLWSLLRRRPFATLTVGALVILSIGHLVDRYLRPSWSDRVERPIYTIGDPECVRGVLAGERIVKLGPLPGNFLYAGGLAFDDPDHALQFIRRELRSPQGWGVFELNGDFDRETHQVHGSARIRRSMLVTRQVYPTQRAVDVAVLQASR